MAEETREVVRVIRPLKVIAFIFSCIAVVMLILSILTNYWLEAEGFRQGLWEYCTTTANIESCNSNIDSVWILACGAICLVALMMSLVAAILSLVGIVSKDRLKKQTFYLSAISVIILTILFLLTALVIFPIFFIHKMEEYQMTYKLTHWFFSWSYGLGWGAWIFLVGAAILLTIDREASCVSGTDVDKARCYNNGI